MGIDEKLLEVVRKDVEKDLEMISLFFKYVTEKSKREELSSQDIDRVERIFSRKITSINNVLSELHRHEED